MHKRCGTFILPITVTLLSAFAESKDLLGLHIETGRWDAIIRNRIQTADIIDPDGDGTTTINATSLSPSQMGLSKDGQSFFSIELRHELPIIPRLKFQKVEAGYTGQFTATGVVHFMDASFEDQSAITSDIDLGYSVITAYYSLLERRVSFDLGLSNQKIDGAITLSIPSAGEDGTSAEVPTTATVDVSNVLVFGKVGFEIPKAPMSIFHEVTYENTGNDHLSSRETKISYQYRHLPSTVGFSVGYRKQKFISSEFGDVASTLTASGPFLSIRMSL